MINYTQPCLDGCGVRQILNINEYAFNDISILQIFNECGNEYDISKLEFSYSLDNVCWSCYYDYNTFLELVADINQDYYLRIKISGSISEVKINGETHTSISTQIDSSCKFGNTTVSSNLYNPYINMDSAIELYQSMTDMVSNVVGIGCYYIKLSPNQNSRDLTFKEYALMGVESIKQIKIIITDNQMPSSKPEFNDFGLDWQSDWEVEVSKQIFATAFGINAQPIEGDLIYIPMMKRMWMLNSAYEEKKDAFMWNTTTFKLVLVKYQEKDSVDLGDAEGFVNSLVKNKYEDLFGDEENVGSGFDSANNDAIYQGRLYNIYESDAIRKSLDLDNIEIVAKSLYYKGTLISDMQYELKGLQKSKQIEYQVKFCGDSGTISFIFTSKRNVLRYEFITIGNLKIRIEQSGTGVILTNINSGVALKLNNGETYFILLRWSKSLNIVEFSASKYTWNKDIPLYKLQPSHYLFDVENRKKDIKKYNDEMIVNDKSSVIVNNFAGELTNFKLFDTYVDDEMLILQMYPTHNHLIINDTARKLITLPGSKI